MNLRCFLSVGAILLALVWRVDNARAKPPVPDVPDCARGPACLSLFEQAYGQSKHGNLPEALRLYKLAYEVKADSKLLFSIGRVLDKLNRKPEAAKYYQRFIDSSIEDAEQKRRAQEYLSQIQASMPAEDPPKVEIDPQRPSLPPSNLDTLTPSSMTSKLKSDVSSKPLYKKWWFWTALGGGVVAITAIGLGVGLSQSAPDINPYEFSF